MKHIDIVLTVPETLAFQAVIEWRRSEPVFTSVTNQDAQHVQRAIQAAREAAFCFSTEVRCIETFGHGRRGGMCFWTDGTSPSEPEWARNWPLLHDLFPNAEMMPLIQQLRRERAAGEKYTAPMKRKGVG